MEHTKGELGWSGKEDMTHGIAITINGAVFATVDGTDEQAIADAKRFVKCWKCHDELIEEIKANTKAMNAGSKHITLLIEQRDALLAACERKKRVVIAMEGNSVWEANYGYMEAAIAAAKERKE